MAPPWVVDKLPYAGLAGQQELRLSFFYLFLGYSLCFYIYFFSYNSLSFVLFLFCF